MVVLRALLLEETTVLQVGEFEVVFLSVVDLGFLKEILLYDEDKIQFKT